MLSGIDLSNNNPDPLDWPLIAKSQQFAFLKLSEGTGYLDGDFAVRYLGARGAGLVVGAYHFAHPSVNPDPRSEAAWFLRCCPALFPGDLVALDIEEVGTTEDRSAWCLEWLSAVTTYLGFRPLLYSYPDYIRHWLTDSRLGAYRLWLASYGGNPLAMGQWTAPAIVQYSDAGEVPGVTGPVDLSHSDLTLTGLRQLGRPGSLPPDPWHVIVPGALKTAATHTSPPVLDAHGLPVLLDHGADVVPLGSVQRGVGGERWELIRVVAPAARGWFLASGLAPGI